MHIENIISFVALNDCKNYQAAADSLFITQPSLTYRIKSLENELGYQLVDRRSHNVKLTSKGTQFLPYAIEISELYAEAKRKVAPDSECINISAVRSISLTLLPLLLERLRQQNSTVNINMMANDTYTNLDRILEGKSHLGILEMVQQPKVACIPVIRDSYLLCASSLHPLSRRKHPMSFAEIAAIQTKMAFNTTSDSWRMIVNTFSLMSLSIQSYCSIDSYEGLKTLIAGGNYVGFLPHTFVGAELKSGQLVSIPMENNDKLYRDICVVYLRKSQPSYARFIIEQLQQIWKEILKDNPA